MTQPREIHQIEYRWEHQQDLVPIASSMSQGDTQSWDAQIYSWVRHPDAEVTPESVRYQLLNDGRAVLAWRYRDPEAAKRDDGTHGRPIVTRVFVAQPGLLTPGIAIALCRTGLPESAGPRPGEVTRGDLLPWLTADELRNLTEDWAETIDREAAGDSGLAELLAVALAEPELPLAIQLRQSYICYPPASGPQPRLLWGMWRIGRPLLGDNGRDWSFSTFEAPLGDSDPARLPAIVFRLDQPVRYAPSRARTERRVSPYNPNTPAPLERYPEMAAWLVEEYQNRGGETLGGLLAESGAGAPLGERLDVVYDQLRAVRRLPPRAAAEEEPSRDETARSGQPEPRHEQHLPAKTGPRDPEERSAQYEPADQDRYQEDRRYAGEAYQSQETGAFQSQEGERRDAVESPYPERRYRPNEYQPVQQETVTFTPSAPDGLPVGQPPESDAGSGQPRPQEPPRRSGPSHRLATVSELLRSLTTASDPREFRSILDRLYDSVDLWPAEAEPQENDPSGSGASGLRRLFSRGGRD
jgi:hypothetical protein